MTHVETAGLESGRAGNDSGGHCCESHLDDGEERENEDDKSRSCLVARDWRRFFLGLVSKPEIKCQKFSVSSRCARLNQRNSHSRLEDEKTTR